MAPSGNLESILGHDKFRREGVGSLTKSNTRCLVLDGPSGSGKTWLASDIASDVAGATPLFAVGDAVRRSEDFAPFESLTRNRSGLEKVVVQGGRVVAGAGSFLSGFGTLGATVFDWAVNASKALTPSNSADFSEEEWKWLGRIRRMSRGRTVVLVADNIHWWDDASFALLKKLGEARDWEEDAFLAKLKMIVVKTTDPTQMDYLGKDFDRWVERVRPERIELEKCNEGKFEEALRCFGVEARIDAPILKVLYDLSAGNLKLAKLVSQSLLDGSNAQQLAEDAASMGLLKTLLTVRRFRLALDLPLIREIAARSIKEDIFLIIDEWVNKTLNFRETKVTFGDPDAEPEYTVDTWLPQGELNELMAEYFPWLDYEYEHEIEDGSGEVEGHTLRVELNELGTGLLTVETFVEEGKEVGTLEPWYEDQSDSIVERYGSDDDWDRN